MNITSKLSFLVLLGFAVLLSACGEKQATQEVRETAVAHAEKHLDPTYVCPMHATIVRDKPGNCPICGMDLVLKEQNEPSNASAEKKILYWVAPMDPAYRRDGPGKSPMGMDLVPVYDEGTGLTVKISPAVENNMGVRTAVAERGKLWRQIETVAYVGLDENKITNIHLRTKGWIENLSVKFEGERVSKGQMLFEVYSPELVNAQEEYLQALRSGSKTLFSASRERLSALGVSSRQIDRLNKTKKIEQYVQVYAPQDGIINKLNVRQGMYVTPQIEVMSLADLSSVWLLAEVFEKQVNWIKVGQTAAVTLSYQPGRTWEGRVEYVYPSLNPKTRTLKVRLIFDNPDESLKPNMFANITIYAEPKSDVVIIPREALIRTGSDARVILSMGEGRFQPRSVVAGMESGEFVEVISGLEAGDRVVTSAQFLIDSEASLKASLQRMQSPDKNKSMSAAQAAMAQPIMGTGVLREVLATGNKVNLNHDPIAALNWPEMTMYFNVSPDVKLDGFKVDDKVEFELEQVKEGYVIKSMKIRNDEGGK